MHCDGMCQYSNATGLNESTVSDDRLHCSSGELNDEMIQKKGVPIRREKLVEPVCSISIYKAMISRYISYIENHLVITLTSSRRII